jgi:hypothetical protein
MNGLLVSSPSGAIPCIGAAPLPTAPGLHLWNDEFYRTVLVAKAISPRMDTVDVAVTATGLSGPGSVLLCFSPNFLKLAHPSSIHQRFFSILIFLVVASK